MRVIGERSSEILPKFNTCYFCFFSFSLSSDLRVPVNDHRCSARGLVFEMEFKEPVDFFSPGENRSDVSSRVTYEKKKRGVKKYTGEYIYIYKMFFAWSENIFHISRIF